MPWVRGDSFHRPVFFLTLNAFVVSPFQVLALDKVVTSVPDGMGLNPLLQYWAMVIHPPMLYLGLRGFRGSLRLRHGVADFESAGR